MCNLATKTLKILEFSFSIELFFLAVVEDPPKFLDPNISYRTFLSTTIPFLGGDKKKILGEKTFLSFVTFDIFFPV